MDTLPKYTMNSNRSLRQNCFQLAILPAKGVERDECDMNSNKRSHHLPMKCKPAEELQLVWQMNDSDNGIPKCTGENAI
jgi:hypothetical protein